MKKNLKILIMNRKYDNVFGGVEYMSTELAKNMTQKDHICDFISLDFKNAKMMYEIPSSSQWYKIATTDSALKANWKERFSRFFKIRKIIKQYDIAIGFQDGAFLSLALSAIGTGIPVIAAERNAVSRFDHTDQGKYRWLRFQLFRLAKKITVQCPSYKNQYPKYLYKKIETISNPVFPILPTTTPERKQPTQMIVTVGRLSYQKNFNVLINAFSNISQEFSDWNLTIVGDGEDMKEMKSSVKNKGLEDRVIFTGYQPNPSAYLRQSDIFCLPSRWEGFPNALAEAMAHGLPCVGFQECSGVSDLIQNNINGYLADGINNENSLSDTLKRVILNKKERTKTGHQAKKDMLEYEPEKIYKEWEILFLNNAKY